MPNTEPPLDDAAIVQSVLERGRQSACDVHVAGCITKGRNGEQLAPMGELYDLGVRVFTDDGDCVADARVMRGAFEYLGRSSSVLRSMPKIRAGERGHMHRGVVGRLGIPGRPAEAGRRSSRRWLAHRRPPRAARVERRRSSWCAPRRPRACASPRCTPQHLVLTDEACAGLIPCSRSIRRWRRDVDALPGFSTARSARSQPTTHHAPETKAAPFEDAARDAGCRDRARGRSRRWSSRGFTRPTRWALSWRPARVGASPTGTEDRLPRAVRRTSA